MALVFTASLFLVSAASAQKKADEARAGTLKKVLSLLEKEDSFSSVEYVQAGGEPLAVATRYFHLVMDLYWKAKNLPGAVTLGRASVQYCLTQAQAVAKTDPEGAKKFRGIAQMLSFNLASFTWPGWAEKGIVPTDADLAFGLDMAKLDLRLVKELKQDARKFSGAYWILGAQFMAAKKYGEAGKAFDAAVSRSREAKDASGEWMNKGYKAILSIIEKPGDEMGVKAFDEALAKLTALGDEDSKFYAKQLRDVRKVFEKK